MDIFMLGFLGAQAKLENDNKAIDVKGGMIKCANNGIYPGCPPLGYLPDKYGIKGARKRNIDPIAFPIVRKMWDKMLAGTHTPYQILNMATEDWGLRTRTGTKLAKSMIYKIFHNTFYYGDFEYPSKSGDWYKGNHKPMITKEEFDRVQNMMRKPDNPRPIKNYFTYGGCILRCGECSCVITGMEKIKKQQNGNVHHYMYYGCTKRRGKCGQMPVTETALTNNVKDVLNQIQIPPGIHEFLMEWVKKEYEKQYGKVDKTSKANNMAYDQCEKRIDELINMRASKLINDDEFQRKKKDIEGEKSRLKQVIENTEHNPVIWLDIADRLFNFAETAAISFEIASPEQKRAILLSLGRNLTIKEKRLDLSTENWIPAITLIAKRLREELSASEPNLPLEYKDKVQNLLVSPYLCSLLHDVRNFFIINNEKISFQS